MCPDPIEFSEIAAYAQAIQITDVDDVMSFVKIVQGIDAAYVSEANKKVK